MSKTTSRKSVNLTKKTRNANRVTLKDVAKKAGVSAITVSRVVNDYAGVRENLRDKVEAAINELGYIPNLSASALASSRSKLIFSKKGFNRLVCCCIGASLSFFLYSKIDM